MSVSSSSAIRSAGRALERALGTEHRRDGLEHDEQIVRDGPVLDVEEVEANVVVERELAAASGLPEAGDAGTNLEPIAVPVLVGGDLLGERRPRPDQAHLALQDVQELRELVQAVAPEPPSDAGDPWILADLEERTRSLVLPLELGEEQLGAPHRGAELVDREGLPLTTDADLLEEHGTPRGDLDRERRCHPDGRSERDRDRGDGQVEAPLHKVLHAA